MIFIPKCLKDLDTFKPGRIIYFVSTVCVDN